MDNKIVFPNYEHSILNLINSILKYYNVQTNYSGLNCLTPYFDKKYKNVILLILDGMGSNLLESIDTNGFFMKNKIDNITSICPSTTTAAMTTYYSGMPPIETGWIAWSQYFKEIGRSLDMFTKADSYTGESYEKISRINVFDSVNYKTVYDKIEEASPNVKAFEIEPSSCSTRAKKHIIADTVQDMCDSIESICTNKYKNFILAYNNCPDSLLHKFGCNSLEVKDFILESEKIIENMTHNLSGTDTLLIICADHGHNDIDKVYSSLDLGELNDFLIIPPSLESRAITFWVKSNKKDEFAKIFQEKFKDKFMLFSKEEFLSKHFLGFGNEHKKIDDFIGDFIAVSISGSIIKLETNISREKPDKLSTHCGFTENEMVVPCIVMEIK